MWGAEDKADALVEVGVEDEVDEENDDDDDGRKERKGDGVAIDRETSVAEEGAEEVERKAATDCKLHLISVMQNASELLCLSPSDVA